MIFGLVFHEGNGVPVGETLNVQQKSDSRMVAVAWGRSLCRSR